jgi:FMN reductase
MVELLVSADALVLGSPVYKGSYAGLFKHLLDLLDPLSLVGKPVLLVATGGGPRHALVIEHQLRPLLGFFEAQTLATGVYASDSDFRDGALVSELLLERLDRAVEQFAPFLSAPLPGTATPEPAYTGGRA